MGAVKHLWDFTSLHLIMKVFFEYIFYSLYRFFQWQDNFWERMGSSNLRKGDLFDSLLILSFLQGLNITTIIIFISTTIGKAEYVKDFHCIYIVALIGVYIYNYLYYQRSGKYKQIIKKMKEKRTSASLMVLYFIMSLVLAILSFLYIPDEIFT